MAFTADGHQRDELTYERSDLWLVTPEGELRRITDDEMRKLMIETSAAVSRWLYLREALLERNPEGYFALLKGYLRMFCRDWDRKKVEVKLRKKKHSTPCFACSEPLVADWRFCPACGHRNG